MKFLKDMDVRGKRVLMRVDFNVPLDAHGAIIDDSRIRATLPSILYVLENGGLLVLMSHLGRPKGKKDSSFSLKPCAERLHELLGRPVIFDSIPEKMHPGDVILLENLRFDPAEENPDSDPSFARRLAALGDIYVNDAFGTAHRRHSSTVDVAAFFPGACCVGFLMEKEIQSLAFLLDNPPSPFYAIIGGAKVSGKLAVLEALVEKVDGLFIGGAMAYTFLAAQGVSIGDSPCEKELYEVVRVLTRRCADRGIKLYLPKDIVIADAFAADAKQQVVSIQAGVPFGWQGMDVGPQTIQVWGKALQDAQVIFWNGPLGVYEFPAFSRGTESIAQFLSGLSIPKVVGGGDSVAAVHALGLASSFSHLSTGGGAALEFIEHRGHLPGIDALA